MVTVLPAETGWQVAGQKAGAGLVSGYTKGADESAIQNAVQKLGKDASPRDILDAITSTRTYGSEAKQEAMQNYGKTLDIDVKQQAREAAQKKAQREEQKYQRDVKKEAEDRQKTREIVKNINLPEGVDPEALSENISLKEAEKLLEKSLEKPEDSEFVREVKKGNAKSMVQLYEEIPKLRDAVSTIDHVREKAKNINPAKGIINTEGASELNALSFPLIEPIVKQFNPVGALPTQKIKMIQDKYQILATDMPWQIEGKLKALEYYANLSYERAVGRAKLLSDYDGYPPIELLERYDRESGTIVDAMIDTNFTGVPLENPSSVGLPSTQADIKEWKGQTLVSEDGAEYYSDGIKWVKL